MKDTPLTPPPSEVISQNTETSSKSHIDTLGDVLSLENTTSSSSGELHLEAVYDIPVQVSAVLGTTVIPVSQLLKLGRGAILELDRKIGEAIDIHVNNRLVARGEIVIVENKIGVTMTEIIKPDKHS